MMMQPYPPPNFGEANPHITTVPFFMRIREHHCISPQEPIPVGGQNNGFDDGLPYAWMPKLRVTERAGKCIINDGHAIRQYDTFKPGKPNSHNEDTCTACARERVEEEARRQERHAAMEGIEETIDEESERFPEMDDDLEDIFESVGLGHDQDGEDDDDEMDGDSEGEESDDYISDSEESVNRSCNGVIDLFFTGEVSLLFFSISLVFLISFVDRS